MSFDVNKHVLHAGDGEELLQGPPATGKVRIVVDPRNTGETKFCTLIQELSPGGVVPPHRHEKAEQVLFFFSGRGKAVMEGHEVDVRPGTTLHVSPNVLHGFRNAGDEPLCVIETTSPPGFEDTFRELAKLTSPDPETVVRIGAKYDILIEADETA